LDPAAQNVLVAGPYLKTIGYRVVYSNLSGKFDAELRQQFGPSLRMNPLASVDINHPHADLEISETASVLVPLKDGDRNPFFAGTAQQLAAGVAIWLRETEGETATWVKVGTSIHGSPSDMNSMFALMKNSRFATVRATAAQWCLGLDDKGNIKTPPQGMADVLSTARRELQFLMNDGIADMFSANEFDFASMKKTRTAFFFVMPDSDNDSLKKCSYLLLRTAKRAQMTPGGLNVLWLLDELCTSLPTAAAQLIQKDAAQIAKYRIRIGGVCQSWSQFLIWCGGPIQADALRSMMGAAIFYGANDETSVKKIMAEAGRYTVWTPGTNPLHEAGIGGNAGSMGVPLFQPEDLHAMISEKKQIVFLIGARQVVVLPRSSYLSVPALKARAALDAFHTQQ
jgi:type IV secretory pathway TraG/TraD family ATPase VirD4